MSKPDSAAPSPSAPPHKEASRAAAAGVDQLKTLSDQVASMERQALDRMKTSLHEATRLWMETIDYAAALSSHWRSFALDAVRRATDIPAA